MYRGEIPFVRLLVPFMMGIGCGYYLPNKLLMNTGWTLCFTAMIMLLLMLFLYKKKGLYRFAWLGGSLVYLILLCFAYALTVDASQRFAAQHFSNILSEALLVEVNSEPRVNDQGARFEADVMHCFSAGATSTCVGRMVIFVKSDSIGLFELKYGDVILIPTSYNAVDPPFNPGEFDYRVYLADRQIYKQAYLTPDMVHRIGNAGNPMISFALDLRQKLVGKFYRYLPDKDAAAFASTLILGYRAELSDELIEAYSKTGTMHVLSVSGMHVAIVFMVLSVILRFMDRTHASRLIRAVLIIFLIGFYALLTGFSAAACRAAVMLSFIVLGKAINRSQNTYNLIAISAFFLLLYNPFYLMDVGFQLSYLAVLGLVYFQPKIYHSVYISNKMLDTIWSYSALSIAAQLGTFPLSVYYFHQFPLSFLISNLCIVLPVALIMYAGLTLMLIPFSAIQSWLGESLNRLINYTNGMLFQIEKMPWSYWGGIWIDQTEHLLLYVLIFCTSGLVFHQQAKLRKVFAVTVALLCLSLTNHSYRNYKKKELVFYNLRQSSAFSYVFNNRSVTVSDLKVGSQSLQFSIRPCLASKGSVQDLFYSVDATFKGASFLGMANFYQFGSFRLIRWGREFEGMKFKHPLQVNAVLLSDNPRITLTDLQRSVQFSLLIIDANNPDYKVESWVREAIRLGVKHYVLKKSPALVIKL